MPGKTHLDIGHEVFLESPENAFSLVGVVVVTKDLTYIMAEDGELEPG